MTRNGEMSVGHLDAAAGDKIFIPPGGQVPLVVRQNSKDHVLIGERYLDGFRGGEAVSVIDEDDEKIDTIALALIPCLVSRIAAAPQ